MRLALVLSLTIAALVTSVQASAQTSVFSGMMRGSDVTTIASQQTPRPEDIAQQITTLQGDLAEAKREVALQRAQVETFKQQASSLTSLAQSLLDVQELSVQRYHHAIDGLHSLQRLIMEARQRQQQLTAWQPPADGPPWPLQLADDTYLLMTESRVLADQYLLHGQLLQNSRQALLNEKQTLEAKIRQARSVPGTANDLFDQRQELAVRLLQAELKAVDLELVFADIFVQTNDLNRVIAELSHQISRKDWLYMDNRFYLDEPAFNRIEQQVQQNITGLLVQQEGIREDNDKAIAAFNQASAELQRIQSAETVNTETVVAAERAMMLASDQAKLQRLRRDVAFYRYEMLEITKQLWQIRFDLYQNRHSSSNLAELNTVFGDMAAQIAGWEQYNQTVSAQTQRERQAFLDGAVLSPTKAEGDYLRARADIMQQYIDTLAQAMSQLTSTQFLLNITLREVETFEHQAPLWQRVLNLGGDIADITSDIWHYEIFTVTDTVTVEGRPITTLRSVTVGKSIGALLILVVGLLLVKRIVSSAMNMALRRNRIGASTSIIITRWISLFAGLTLIIFSLVLMDIPLSIFAFAGGALAIGIGFGAQHLLQNLISGLILLLEKPVRVGDWIEIGGVTGSVTSIGIRFSTLTSATGTEHLIPNSALVQEKLVNWTYSSPEVRREIHVWVDYRADTQTVSNILINVAKDHPVVMDVPEPRVLLDGFTERGMQFKLQFWAPMLAKVSGPVVMSEIRKEIHARFTKYGIAFAHPMRSITLEQNTGEQT